MAAGRLSYSYRYSHGDGSARAANIPKGHGTVGASDGHHRLVLDGHVVWPKSAEALGNYGVDSRISCGRAVADFLFFCPRNFTGDKRIVEHLAAIGISVLVRRMAGPQSGEKRRFHY